MLLREGPASLCERVGYEVAGQAGDATRLLELVADERPDLVIVDIRMLPDHSTEGLKVARTIRERHPGTGILVLSAYVEVEDALELLASGRKAGSAQRRADPLSHLSGRDREVLALTEDTDDHRRYWRFSPSWSPADGGGPLSTGPPRCQFPPVGCETWPTPPATAPSRDRSRTLPGCTGSATSTAG
ncbi:response regulator transcription factor [Streptomyces sp. V4I2]|uniref:response regulator n=1 Tax=Streptomyces sp. V4I2 TaxID=3042280 RepID=UPI0027863356|nr:CheY-like chemotaxis protein [Streptomyces sp. V4I2]